MLIFSTGGNSSRHYSILSLTHADHSLVKTFLPDNKYRATKQFGSKGKYYKLNNNKVKKNSAKYSVKIRIN